MLFTAKRVKNRTADVQWIMCEVLTGNWKKPTMFSATGQLQGNVTIIAPHTPERVVMRLSYHL